MEEGEEMEGASQEESVGDFVKLCTSQIESRIKEDFKKLEAKKDQDLDSVEQEFQKHVSWKSKQRDSEKERIQQVYRDKVALMISERKKQLYAAMSSKERTLSYFESAWVAVFGGVKS